MAVQSNYGTGRRKSAVARVFLKPGKGTIVVNGKPVDEFFSRETGRMIVRQPLQITDRLQSFDIAVNDWDPAVSDETRLERQSQIFWVDPGPQYANNPNGIGPMTLSSGGSDAGL